MTNFASMDADAVEQPSTYYPDGEPSNAKEKKKAGWVKVYCESSKRVTKAVKMARKKYPQLRPMNLNEEEVFFKNNPKAREHLLKLKYLNGYIHSWGNLTKDKGVELKFTEESIDFLFETPSANSFLSGIMQTANDGNRYGIPSADDDMDEDDKTDLPTGDEDDEVSKK